MNEKRKPQIWGFLLQIEKLHTEFLLIAGLRLIKIRCILDSHNTI